MAMYNRMGQGTSLCPLFFQRYLRHLARSKYVMFVSQVIPSNELSVADCILIIESTMYTSKNTQQQDSNQTISRRTAIVTCTYDIMPSFWLFCSFVFCSICVSSSGCTNHSLQRVGWELVKFYWLMSDVSNAKFSSMRPPPKKKINK